MPGAKFQREALEAKEELYDMVQSPVRGMKARLAAGEVSNSYIGKLLEEGEYEEDYIAWSAISVYTGGADTTVSAMNNFILSMMLNPDAQRAAQKEIDSIVGNQRLPRLEDRPALKYVNACIKETQRWRTVTPLGVAHVCEKEDSYGGYRIPKGATLIGNIWAMMHDEEIYSDPFKFLPERFLDDERNENSKRSKEKDVMYAFGFGRR
ncbi:hypothetical protein FRC03_005536 [Tulasnella sp. 419]|nr:hypothetical protein FRC03_005536 [Tulasnella sp. 419]